MRVTFCLTSFIVGGTELNAIRTAEGLDRRKFDLSVFALSREGPLIERYEAAGIPVHIFDTPSFTDLRTLPQTIRLARFLKDNRTQVLHAHSIYANVFGVPAGIIAGVPCIISSRRWWRRQVSRPLGVGNRIADRLAHRVLTNAQGVAALLADEEGVPPSKITVLPNFVDSEGFDTPSPEALRDLRAALGVHADQKVVGIVARLAPVKDHRTLIEAFAQVHRSHPEWVLALAGDGDQRAALEGQVADLGLSDAVRFAGLLPHQPSAHHAFDLSVLSSLSEGFPNSVAEAMAAGNAVVGTNVGGVPDAIDHGVTGLLVPSKDPPAMATALQRLMSDDVERGRMGDAGFKKAQRHFTRDRVLEQLEAIYRDVLG